MQLTKQFHSSDKLLNKIKNLGGLTKGKNDMDNIHIWIGIIHYQHAKKINIRENNGS